MTRKKNRKFFAIIALVFAFVLTSAILSFSGLNVLNSNAYTAGSAPDSIGSLILGDYATRGDGKVFDGNVLDKLYSAILGTTDKKTYTELYDAVNSSQSLTTGTTSTGQNVNTQDHSMNFSHINGGNAITVEFGGYKWNVVYATTNTLDGSDGNTKAGDLIVTLWMSENLSGTYQWNEYTSDNTSNSYPSSMYSTSKIRVDTLNGGGDAGAMYAKSLTSLTGTQGDRINHPFSVFTMSAATAVGKRSLTQYLAQPHSVVYQQKENFVWSYGGTTSPFLLPNEAWGMGTDGPDTSLVYLGSSGWYAGSSTNISNMLQLIDKPQYYDWVNDYLWLPSLTETGYKRNGSASEGSDYSYGTSLWGIPNSANNSSSNIYAHNILKSSGSSWLRSAARTNVRNTGTLTATGGHYDVPTSTQCAIRPALHLNLTQASKNFTREINSPTDVSLEYTGNALSMDDVAPADKAWYDASILDIEYPADMTNAGTKAVKAKIKSSAAEYSFKNPTTSSAAKERTFNFNIIKRKIGVTFDQNGVTNIQGVFASDNGTARAPDLVLKFSLQSGGAEFDTLPTAAGKYKVRVVINNPSTCNYELNDATASKYVNFDIRGAVTITADDLIWQANDNVPSSFALPWLPGGYTITVSEYTSDGASLADKGVKIQGYSGNVIENNVSSNYVAKVRLVNLDETFDAYDREFTLDWSINTHKVTKPAYSGDEIVFNNRDVDFISLLGVPQDWANYLTIDIKKNGLAYTDYTAKEIGDYVLVFRFKPELGVGNVVWDNPDDPEDITFVSITVKIVPRVIKVNGWTSSGIPNIQVDDANDRDFINRVYSDLNGATVTYEDVMNTYNTTFRVKVESKYGDNVRIEYSDGVNDYAEFTTPADPLNPATPIAKPTLKEDSKFYTASTLTFELDGFDDSIMAIASGSLTVTDKGEYTIVIRFRDGANYVWEDGTRDAITLTFSVVEDPDNPNPTPPEKPGDGGSFIDKIKDFFEKLIESHFPLWQVITSCVAILFTLIFMIKAIQYGNRKKKANGEAKKYNAKTYAAGLLPIFATDIVWLNLSNMVWSIIAFSLCGVMLLMFLIALITRRGWKKAELAKETAIEESEQRKLEAEKQEREAEKQERREFQERISQGGDSTALLAEMRRELQETLAQVNNGGGSDNNSLIIEQMRREMEERRREDEERHRQEMEAMKLMLANIMGRAQTDGMPTFPSMEDTDLIADKVFARLLPAVQQMMPKPTAYLAAPNEQNDEFRAIAAEQNEEIKALTAEVAAMREQLALQAVGSTVINTVENDDDDLDDDEEEWDSILDEDDDDFVEAVIIEEDGTVKKTYPNFRMRLKQSSDKNREWYAAVKNLFCSQKGVTYRVYKRVEKIRYQGQVIAVIGIAKRSIKLWLALKPYEYDARRYHHKDVSDKPRFVDVPMYVRVSSDRALTRAQELILALFQELNMEARKRYNDRSIQELIFTLKHNKLLTNKQNKGLLCEVMHVHDCDVLSDELAEKCIESKNVESIDESLIETLKLDDIDAAFQDGNRVTLEKLKKVGLVSEECTGYTVTAGHRLTKPLIIVANDFTLPAVKMITLTGGRAIKLNQI